MVRIQMFFFVCSRSHSRARSRSAVAAAGAAKFRVRSRRMQSVYRTEKCTRLIGAQSAQPNASILVIELAPSTRQRTFEWYLLNQGNPFNMLAGVSSCRGGRFISERCINALCCF